MKKLKRFFSKAWQFFSWPFHSRNLKWTFMFVWLSGLCLMILSSYTGPDWISLVGVPLFVSPVVYSIYCIKRYFKNKIAAKKESKQKNSNC